MKPWLIASSALLAVGCSAPQLIGSKTGFTTVSRNMSSVPAVSSQDFRSRSLSMGQGVLAYMPQVSDNFKPAVNERWISVDSTSGVITVKDGQKELLSLGTDARFDKGTFTIKKVQENPVWYAPDSYFTSRNLEVPAADSPERYRRGALGQLAVYLSNGTVLHSSLVSDSEVQGSRVPADDLKKFAKFISEGVPLVVS